MKKPKPRRQSPPQSSPNTILLETDRQNSVLAELESTEIARVRYSTYGQRSTEVNPMTSMAFNGEFREPDTGWYLLGNGYRAYNPMLMRFHSPDSLSPFGKGGLNSYAYCVGDPVNHTDPTGHFAWSFLLRMMTAQSLKNIGRFSSLAGVATVFGAFLIPKGKTRTTVAVVAGGLAMLGFGLAVGVNAYRLFSGPRISTGTAAPPIPALSAQAPGVLAVSAPRFDQQLSPNTFNYRGDPPPAYSSLFTNPTSSRSGASLNLPATPPPPYQGLTADQEFHWPSHLSSMSSGRSRSIDSTENQPNTFAMATFRQGGGR